MLHTKTLFGIDMVGNTHSLKDKYNAASQKQNFETDDFIIDHASLLTLQYMILF